MPEASELNSVVYCFEEIFGTMGPKAQATKSRRSISVHVKQEIICKHESGMTMTELSNEYGLRRTTIATIIRYKDKYKAQRVADNRTRVFKGMELMVEMERLLLIWIREKQANGETLNRDFIRGRAKAIYEALKRQAPHGPGYQYEDFRASKGWFRNFKKRTNISCVETQAGEAAASQAIGSSADDEAAEAFRTAFHAMVEEEGYLPQQVFNVGETGLFWKRMPRRTCIAKEDAATSPGRRRTNDRLSLLLGANASGDFRLKPMLVYHSVMPNVFKQKRVNRAELGVYWQSDPKACVTRTLFQEWAIDVFCPSVKSYLTQNKMEPKALLLLDNVLGRDPDLEAALKVHFPFIRVASFPPDTSTLLRPLDQQITTHFKRLYTQKVFRKCHEATTTGRTVTLKEFWKSDFNILEAVKSIVTAWHDVPVRCINAAWQPLWPAVRQDDGGFEDGAAVDAEIAALGESLGLEIDPGDVEDLVASDCVVHATNDELEDLNSFAENDREEEEVECEQEEPLTTSDIQAFLEHWAAVKKMMTRHPAIAQTELMISNFEENGISYFRTLLKERMKESPQKRFGGNSSTKKCLAMPRSPASSSAMPSTSSAAQTAKASNRDSPET